MQAERLKDLAVDALDDLKGKEIQVMDVRGKSPVTDFMVMASGISDRQVKGLANHLIIKAKAQGVRLIGVEGEGVGDWILVDLGDVIVHVMQPHVRAFYNLEQLWGEEGPRMKIGDSSSRGKAEALARPL